MIEQPHPLRDLARKIRMMAEVHPAHGQAAVIVNNCVEHLVLLAQSHERNRIESKEEPQHLGSTQIDGVFTYEGGNRVCRLRIKGKVYPKRFYDFADALWWSKTPKGTAALKIFIKTECGGSARSPEG